MIGEVGGIRSALAPITDDVTPPASTASAVADGATVSTTTAMEVQLVRLKAQLALDAQRETLSTNVSSAYHRSATAIIGNLKA